MVTLHELQTVYGVEDLYKLLEVGQVYSHNKRTAIKAAQDAAKEPR